jgi:hypothetical protein
VDWLDFERGNAETHRPSRPADFVWCNGVSQEALSRRRLVENLRAAAAPGAWIHVGELCEGYPLRGIVTAVEGRDARELELRARQAVNGCLGRPGYRFFLAGTMRGLFEATGIEGTETEAERWNGLIVFQRDWGRRSEEPARSRWSDGDYPAADPELAEMRERFGRLLRERPRGGFDAGGRAEIKRSARESPNRLAPLVLCLLATDLRPGSLKASPGMPATALRRLRDRAGGDGVDWESADELRDEILAAVTRG